MNNIRSVTSDCCDIMSQALKIIIHWFGLEVEYKS